MALRALQSTASGTGPVGGSGTIDTIPRWTAASTLGDSLLSQSGAIVTNSGTFRAANGTFSEPAYTFSGSSGMGMYRSTSGALLRFAVSGAYAFGVDTNGNVGIGTTAPASFITTNSTVLAVGGAGNLGTVRVSNTANFSGNHAEFFAGASNVGIWGSSNCPMLFYTNSVERMRMSATGVAAASQVAIGTTSFTSGCSLTVAQSIDASQSAQGLKLPATPGNSDTQTLDCYQEGTYTPTTTGFGGTVSSATGAFTRIGRMVFCEVVLNGTAMTATYGTAIVSAPFTIAAGCNSTVQAQSPVGYGIGATNPSTTQLYVPTMASSSTMRFTCTYFV